jgi:hypothetical protein
LQPWLRRFYAEYHAAFSISPPVSERGFFTFHHTDSRELAKFVYLTSSNHFYKDLKNYFEGSFSSVFVTTGFSEVFATLGVGDFSGFYLALSFQLLFFSLKFSAMT